MRLDAVVRRRTGQIGRNAGYWPVNDKVEPLTANQIFFRELPDLMMGAFQT